MRVLLSIKPVFAEKIFSGKKKYEFRRSMFKRAEIKTVVVYASTPVRKIIGEFEIGDILYEDIDSLWQKTQRHSGITEDYFYKYFDKKEQGFAIKIKSFKKYKEPVSLKRRYGVLPPQSYTYL